MTLLNAEIIFENFQDELNDLLHNKRFAMFQIENAIHYYNHQYLIEQFNDVENNNLEKKYFNFIMDYCERVINAHKVLDDDLKSAWRNHLKKQQKNTVSKIDTFTVVEEPKTINKIDSKKIDLFAGCDPVYFERNYTLL